MKVSVLLFARYREVAGGPSLQLDLPDGATVEEVWRRVQAEVPALRGEGLPLFACDRVYATADRRLTGREEIAIFPPVSGG